MTPVNQWTNPRTWVGGEQALAAFFNAHIRDNFTHLKSRPFINGATGVQTTTSSTFVQMTGSSVNLTTTGGYILFWASGYTYNSVGGASNFARFDLAIDGIRQGNATNGTTIVQGTAASYHDNINLMMLTGGGAGGSLLAAGVHTCSIYWNVSANTQTASLQIFAMEIC